MYQLRKKNLAYSVAIYGRGREIFRPPMCVCVCVYIYIYNERCKYCVSCPTNFLNKTDLYTLKLSKSFFLFMPYSELTHTRISKTSGQVYCRFLSLLICITLHMNTSLRFFLEPALLLTLRVLLISKKKIFLKFTKPLQSST